MNRRFIQWTTMIAAIFFLITGTAWADGQRGHGPGKGDDKSYHQAPKRPAGHGHPGVYTNPPHFKKEQHQFQAPPSQHKGNSHGQPYVSSYHQHHKHAPAPPPRHHHRPAPPPPHHHHRPAPPVVYYQPAPPPPQPFGGFMVSATVSDPGFAFGFAIGESW